MGIIQHQLSTGKGGKLKQNSLHFDSDRLQHLQDVSVDQDALIIKKGKTPNGKERREGKGRREAEREGPGGGEGGRAGGRKEGRKDGRKLVARCGIDADVRGVDREVGIILERLRGGGAGHTHEESTTTPCSQAHEKKTDYQQLTLRKNTA